MVSTFDERFELNERAKENIIYDEHVIRYQFVREYVKNKVVLEIASGSGYGANMLANSGAKKVFAIDIDDKAIKKAQEKYKKENLKFKVGDAENIEIEDASIDALVSFETIEHLKHPESFLKEAKRVLKDDGVVFISTPNEEVFHNQNPYHIKEYTKEEFVQELKKEFSFVHIMSERNAIASYIDGVNDRQEMSISSKTKALYFIAICSNTEFDKNIFERQVLSLNGVALENLYNNPGLKFVNKIYSLIIKIPGIKKILK